MRERFKRAKFGGWKTYARFVDRKLVRKTIEFPITWHNSRGARGTGGFFVYTASHKNRQLYDFRVNITSILFVFPSSYRSSRKYVAKSEREKSADRRRTFDATDSTSSWNSIGQCTIGKRTFQSDRIRTCSTVASNNLYGIRRRYIERRYIDRSYSARVDVVARISGTRD